MIVVAFRATSAKPPPPPTCPLECLHQRPTVCPATSRGRCIHCPTTTKLRCQPTWGKMELTVLFYTTRWGAEYSEPQWIKKNKNLNTGLNIFCYFYYFFFNSVFFFLSSRNSFIKGMLEEKVHHQDIVLLKMWYICIKEDFSCPPWKVIQNVNEVTCCVAAAAAPITSTWARQPAAPFTRRCPSTCRPIIAAPCRPRPTLLLLQLRSTNSTKRKEHTTSSPSSKRQQ